MLKVDMKTSKLYVGLAKREIIWWVFVVLDLKVHSASLVEQNSFSPS